MLRRMRYFIAVVETGSFSEAAEACHISQSAISQQIRSLEDELGVLLLERRGRRFEVTPAGRYFYQQARRQSAELDSVVREVRRVGSGEYQQLRIGVLSGFSSRVMQNAVNEFVATHPNVRVFIASGTHEHIFQRLMAGQLDMVVNDQRRALADHFVNVELGDQPLQAMLRKDSDAAKQPSISPEELGDALCVVVSSPEQRENETSYWRDVMRVRGDILFVDNVEDARLNVAAGIGWYPCDRDMEPATGSVLVPLARAGAPLTRRMFAFWPETSDSSLRREFSAALSRYFV